VITMGSERQKHIESLFGKMDDAFEPPAFSPGVPSRSLRNRSEFFRYAHEAGLLPQEEWEAIEATSKDLKARNYEGVDTERFFDCLEGVPVTTGRRGNPQEILLHYSVELWRKAKTVNRGRAVLGCTLAHLIAMKRLVDEGFDLILEDNVRAPVESCAERIWECLAASEELQHKDENAKCHLRFMGWLGSIPNLKWILETHAPKRAFPRSAAANNGNNNNNPRVPISVFPFPRMEHLKEDMAEMNFDKDEDRAEGKDEDQSNENDDENDNEKSDSKFEHKTPGGNPVWGCYAYWVSKEAHEKLIIRLQNDVGACFCWISCRRVVVGVAFRLIN
jgi:GR25 family glycosyltransferase involved in LPS biosynthesis